MGDDSGVIVKQRPLVSRYRFYGTIRRGRHEARLSFETWTVPVWGERFDDVM